MRWMRSAPPTPQQHVPRFRIGRRQGVITKIQRRRQVHRLPEKYLTSTSPDCHLAEDARSRDQRLVHEPSPRTQLSKREAKTAPDAPPSLVGQSRSGGC